MSERYLKQRPHEKDHFSTTIYNADSTELPSLLAEALGQKVAGEKDFRCELTIMHNDPNRLRSIYRERDERIGSELVGTLTTEATRTYFSQIRVGFLSPNSAAAGGRAIDVKPHDRVSADDAAPLSVGVAESFLLGDGSAARMDRVEFRTLLTKVRDEAPKRMAFTRLHRFGMPPEDSCS